MLNQIGSVAPKLLRRKQSFSAVRPIVGFRDAMEEKKCAQR